MTGLQAVTLGVLLSAASMASAGDPGALPTTENAFRNRIQSFIKPGDDLETALKALESQRFECREFSNKNPVFHCSRMDTPDAASAGWFYQVMIEPKGSLVGSVSPSLGKMRR
jgi:hypothetical protein